jgi:hypothetical protein
MILNYWTRMQVDECLLVKSQDSHFLNPHEISGQQRNLRTATFEISGQPLFESAWNLRTKSQDSHFLNPQNSAFPFKRSALLLLQALTHLAVFSNSSFYCHLENGTNCLVNKVGVSD